MGPTNRRQHWKKCDKSVYSEKFGFDRKVERLKNNLELNTMEIGLGGLVIMDVEQSQRFGVLTM
mgnify:CR=1 FL=1|jgi:hypothetical protein